MFPKSKSKSILTAAFIFAFAFLIGNAAARTKNRFFPETVQTAAEGNWGLSFQTEGEPPIGNAAADELRKYDAYYIGNSSAQDENTVSGTSTESADSADKVIYLTFDAGYENGNTSAILDALKKHNAPATFFCVGTFLKENPELIKRMTAECHTVGNHTYHHKDMSQISTKEAFAEEIQSVEKLYEEITGKPMTKYYRPPQGKYSEANLKMAQEMGYKTFFWSLAYVDWYENDQPAKETAFGKLLPRIHPGAIVLLHSTSKTNAEILDELLTKWEEMGYRFEDLSKIK